MPEPLKKFRVLIELELTINPLIRESFEGLTREDDEDFVALHMNHQRELQAAILDNPNVLEPYLHTVVSGYLDGHGGEIALEAFGGEDYPTVEQLAVQAATPETRKFFGSVLKEELMAENTEELSNSFVITTVSGTITEI